MNDAAAPLESIGEHGLLLDALVDALRRALPQEVSAQALSVRRRRSLADRLTGRPGRTEELTLGGPDTVLTLRASRAGSVTGQAERSVRGVVISRRAVSLREGLDVLEEQVAGLAAAHASDAAAVSRALVALGVRSPAELSVDPHDVGGGLRALDAELAARLPDEAAEVVHHICELLTMTLPRVGGTGEAEVLVRRTATVYLPETLRVYLALPPQWAVSHVLPDGSTAAAALVSQLRTLESAVRSMHDAALEQDATTLLVNGAFLADRFAPSSLDLP